MSVAAVPPHRLGAEAAHRLVEERWELGDAAVREELPSERDENFLLTGSAGAFVFKIAQLGEERELIDAQDAVLRRVAASARRFAVPLPVPSSQGRLVEEVAGEDGKRLVRVLRYLPGTPLAVQDKDGLASELGAALGELSAILAGFRHSGAVRDLRWDLRRAPEVLAEHGEEITDPVRRRLLERRVESLRPWLDGLPGLRTSVAHNDANDYNVLVDDGRISGLIDFGDLVETVTVAEPAVGLAYAMLGARDPLGVARRLAGAFHERFALEPEEASALLPLALARLCVSVTLAAHQRRLAPENEYLSISERDAWALLERLDDLPLEVSAERVAAACRPTAAAGRRPAGGLLADRRRLTGPSLSLSYRRPLHIVRGAGAYLYDGDGRSYLDCVNNVCHVGHAHPRVVEAGARQMAALNTNTRYLHEALVAYAERLAETLPDPLRVCFFVCSGSEANELALRLARTATGRHDVVVLDAAYHGNTSSLVELSPYKFAGPGGFEQPAHVHVAPLPDPYRGAHRGPDAGARYAADVRATLAEAPVAALFAESLPGCAGQIVPPAGFLREAFEAARASGAVAVADEVQVGLGRVGRRFWGFELDAAVPDIVTMGKPLGNGHPLGAVVTTPAIAEAFANGMEYFNTFGGNPVSCATGLAVLDVIRDEGLQAHAQEVGDHLLERLTALGARHALVGEARGAGLYAGIELVRDGTTLEPAAAEAARVVELAREEGVLLSTDGPLHNVIKVKPPLAFGTTEADRLADTLDRALATVESQDP